jgi:hypothetical protein
VTKGINTNYDLKTVCTSDVRLSERKTMEHITKPYKKIRITSKGVDKVSLESSGSNHGEKNKIIKNAVISIN